MTEDTRDAENTYEEPNRYLSPEEFASNLFEQEEFVVLVWDKEKYRLGQRIKEMMKLGYRPVSGSIQTHTVYQETSRNSPNRIPVKEDLCILMIHEGLFNKVVGGSANAGDK